MSNTGVMAAGTGDLTVKAASLTNERTPMTVETTTETSTPDSTTTVVTTTEVVGADSAAAQFFSGGNLVIETGALVNRHGRIAALGDLTIEADSLTNTGRALQRTVATTTVSGGTPTTYTTTDTYEVVGAIEALGTLTATVDGELTSSGQLASQDELLITTGARVELTADSVTNGAAGLRIEAAELDNAGATGSAWGNLEVELTGDLTNTGLLYSGASSHYRLDGAFTNTEADVIAEHHLIIEGRDNARAGALTNTSATMEAVAGSVLLKVASFTNERSVLVIEESTSPPVVSAPVTVEDEIRRGAFGIVIYRPTCFREPKNNFLCERWRVTTTTTEETSTEYVAEISDPGRLLAGQDIRIETAELTNEYSQIEAGGNIVVRADDLVVNNGYSLESATTVTTNKQHWEEYCHWVLCATSYTDEWSEEEVAHPPGSPVLGADGEPIRIPATIHAAGSVVFELVNATGKFINDDIRGGESTTIPEFDEPLEDVEVEESTETETIAEAEVEQEPEDTDTDLDTTVEPVIEDEETEDSAPDEPHRERHLVTLAELTANIDTLLERTALFREQLSPSMPYLIETRPEFIKRSRYLGSDYFLDRVGLLNGDQILKRLGDSYVETRLIRSQIFDLTGRRYLGEAHDDRSLMQMLYDNAFDARESLALRVGVALSPSQIAALSRDLIWLEWETIRGQKVLVPRLYLATSTLQSVDASSARISGSKTIIKSGYVVNSGTISGSDALAIQATYDVWNKRGSLLSEGDIGIQAGRLFANLSGQVIGGGNVAIEAAGILNNTLVIRDEQKHGFTDYLQEVAQISAGGTLYLSAADFIKSLGGSFSSGEGMTLQAGGDIEISAQAVGYQRRVEYHDGFEHSQTLTHELAQVEAGGGLTISAGGNLGLRGVELSAGEEATLFAQGDVTIESVQDIHHEESRRDSRSEGFLGFASTGTETHELDSGTETQRTMLSAGGELSIASGTGDLTLDAVGLQSGDDITLSAVEGTVSFLTNTDSSSERSYEYHEGLLWYTEKDQGHNKESIEHVEIEQGGKLNIVAGKGVVVEFERDGSRDKSLDELVQSPELAWMQQLRDDPDLEVQWQEVEAAFKEWDYESQGLTATGAALVSLIVGVATGGAVSGAVEGIMGALNITSTAVQSAIHAGLSSLVNQAAVTLVNNQGDLGATLQQLASLETLTSLAGTMLTAGLTTGLTEAAGLGTELLNTAPLADRVSQDIAQGVIAVGVDTAVSTVVEGQDLGDALLGSLRSEAAGILGENVAQEIGAAVANGDMDTAGQLIAHAALGCVTGLIGSDDCASGAGGAVIGEAAALIYRDQIVSWLEDAEAGSMSLAQLGAQLDDMKRVGVDIAKLAGGLAVGLAGGNVDVAAQAGANAAENNALHIILVIQAHLRGDGDIGAGLAEMGSSEDPLSQAIASYAAATARWFVAELPLVMQDFADRLEQAGGDNPLSQALASEAASAVSWFAEEYSDFTQDVLGMLTEGGGAIDAVITYIDEATGQQIEKRWNDLDPVTRDQLRGAGRIVSLYIPEATVAAFRALQTPSPSAGGSVPGLPQHIVTLSESHLTGNGTTVLGSFPGYVQKAKSEGDSYFDIGNAWDELSDDQKWAANRHFLDITANKGDRVVVSISKDNIRPDTWLDQEIEYLIAERDYEWANQWSLRPRNK